MGPILVKKKRSLDEGVNTQNCEEIVKSAIYEVTSSKNNLRTPTIFPPCDSFTGHYLAIITHTKQWWFFIWNVQFIKRKVQCKRVSLVNITSVSLSLNWIWLHLVMIPWPLFYRNLPLCKSSLSSPIHWHQSQIFCLILSHVTCVKILQGAHHLQSTCYSYQRDMIVQPVDCHMFKWNEKSPSDLKIELTSWVLY